MRPRGAFRLANHRLANPTNPRLVNTGPVFDPFLDPLRSDRRTQRLLESLRNEILEGGGGPNLRIRQVFQNPREIYRLELQLPELAYHRTTLLDRDALEELLESDDVRAVVDRSTPDH